MKFLCTTACGPMVGIQARFLPCFPSISPLHVRTNSMIPALSLKEFTQLMIEVLGRSEPSNSCRWFLAHSVFGFAQRIVE